MSDEEIERILTSWTHQLDAMLELVPPGERASLAERFFARYRTHLSRRESSLGMKLPPRGGE